MLLFLLSAPFLLMWPMCQSPHFACDVLVYCTTINRLIPCLTLGLTYRRCLGIIQDHQMLVPIFGIGPSSMIGYVAIWASISPQAHAIFSPLSHGHFHPLVCSFLLRVLQLSTHYHVHRSSLVCSSPYVIYHMHNLPLNTLLADCTAWELCTYIY